jgi:hypothetical protein
MRENYLWIEKIEDHGSVNAVPKKASKITGAGILPSETTK